MSDLVVSFEPESGIAPPSTGPAVPRTAIVLLWVLAGLEALGGLALVSVYLVTRDYSFGDGVGAGRLVQAAASLLFAVALVVLARGVRRGSAWARYAAFGVAGYEILAVFFGLVDMSELLMYLADTWWNTAPLLPMIGSQLLGSLSQAIVAGFLFRALAAPALRDHCEPRG